MVVEGGGVSNMILKYLLKHDSKRGDSISTIGRSKRAKEDNWSRLDSSHFRLPLGEVSES